jgi:Holliday junction resolvase RusA-like endonuclease
MFFVVKGPPVPKARARVVTMGSKTHAVTPARTAQYEALVRMHALSARQKEPAWRLDAPGYAVEIDVHRSARRGDLDNFAKAILDACNGVLWVDDRFVMLLHAEIFECSRGQEHVYVSVEPRGRSEAR